MAGSGGLHGFTRWPHAMLTDSGGFQAFSLGAGAAAEGPAREARRGRLRVPLAPRRLAAAPLARGGDARAGRCSAPTSRCSSTCARRASRRATSSRRAVRAHDALGAARLARRARTQALFGIVQGAARRPAPRARRGARGARPALRRPRARRLLASASPSRRCTRRSPRSRTASIRERPRYLMGVGTPQRSARGDRRRRRHVRLRAADAQRAQRPGAHALRPRRHQAGAVAQGRRAPSTRECACPCCARRLLARLPAAPLPRRRDASCSASSPRTTCTSTASSCAARARPSARAAGPPTRPTTLARLDAANEACRSGRRFRAHVTLYAAAGE